jgi:ubiquinone biosynthesis accessory factor UbiK
MIPWLRVDELANSLAGFLPAGAEVLSEDFKKNLRAFLNTALVRMDLVTREEFDVQAALLARTRIRLEALEKQVARLEAEVLKQASPPP